MVTKGLIEFHWGASSADISAGVFFGRGLYHCWVKGYYFWLFLPIAGCSCGMDNLLDWGVFFFKGGYCGVIGRRVVGSQLQPCAMVCPVG